jgi:O-6-methylguanine DNA methyltransferase
MEMGLVSREFQTSLGGLLAAVAEDKICRIAFAVEDADRWNLWFDRHFSRIPDVGKHPVLDELEAQLNEYFSGNRREFSVPRDLRGTDFQTRIWARLLEIPYGATVTYGDIAYEMGIEGGSRAIGGAVGSNPIPIVVPCHRVVGSSGHLVGFGGGIELKERLLEIEGARIPFGP